MGDQLTTNGGQQRRIPQDWTASTFPPLINNSNSSSSAFNLSLNSNPSTNGQLPPSAESWSQDDLPDIDSTVPSKPICLLSDRIKALTPFLSFD